MELILVTIGVLAIMVVAAGLGFVLGWILTETRFRIPIDFKPFNCRPCLTFWLTLVFEALIVVPGAFVAPSLGVCPANVGAVVILLAAIAVGLSLLLFCYIKLKFRIYD